MFRILFFCVLALATLPTFAQSPELEQGAFGKRVETLQRTLNARLQPTPNLSIDGDFGPATKAAVLRFQDAKGLEVTGVVTEKVWKAMGTLIEQDEPVRSPDVVNSEKLPLIAPPSVDAPPIVTCESWVIGDPKTGDVLFHSGSDQPRQAASTTKIMTAFVVLEYAKVHPAVLDEMVTFSKAADETVGSTSAVREGEQVSVRNLLYGLLLPSGNDASVALAEHIGARIVDSPGNEPGGNCAWFVYLMNETAKRLKMTNTHYENTHGLSDPKHLTTAADLLRLSTHAMKHPLFRQIVSTRQYGVSLRNGQGEQRNVVWKNTNRLLEIDGYSGIKTGTTTAAGACLVAHGQRNGDSLTVVVLGSSSSAARYADVRNLFRWAWAKRAK